MKAFFLSISLLLLSPAIVCSAQADGDAAQREYRTTIQARGNNLTGICIVARWEGTRAGHRGEEYENFKRKKAEVMIDALEEEVPDIRYHLEGYYTSSPLTYLDYTGTPRGAMYGIAKDIQAIGMDTVSCKTSIPNLLLTGQNTAMHGMFGVMAGSLITCSEVLSKETVFSQLEAL